MLYFVSDFISCNIKNKKKAKKNIKRRRDVGLRIIGGLPTSITMMKFNFKNLSDEQIRCKIRFLEECGADLDTVDEMLSELWQELDSRK